VGFRTHDQGAVEIALRNTVFSVCGEDDGRVVGVGRIIGDGAISFLLTNVIVLPTHQHQGIGSAMVKTLLTELDGGCRTKIYYWKFCLNPHPHAFTNVSASGLPAMLLQEW